MMNIIMKILFLLLSLFAIVSQSVPLSTKSKWIVDSSSGERVKLKCGNWAGHMETMLPEGLHKRPLSSIARQASLIGFNCIRLTWATYMFTRHRYLTVLQNFKNLGHETAIEGLKENNPDIMDMTLADAQKAVIEALGINGIMVILDNQVGKPMWCCSNDDGNGFFGDKYFEPKEWEKGLAIVARRYMNTSNVVGMSLRNELRGPRQNHKDWYHYVRTGALTIHKTNPNVLVLISGLDYDLDFTPLKKTPLGLRFTEKLVYETHRYSFTEGQSANWLNEPINKVCKSVIEEVHNKTGFLREGSHPAPLIITEFGIDQRLNNTSDNLFMSCYLAYLADTDLDWALWAMQGSYYNRDGKDDLEETYGIFNGNWTQLRSPEFHERLQQIQQMTQDPNGKESINKILFHPLSGRCIRVNKDQVYPSDCLGSERWSHAGDRTPIKLVGTNKCLKSSGEGFPVTLSDNCVGEQTTWKMVPDGLFQIANEDANGNNMCLDWDPNYSSKILTNKCICADEDDTNCLDNPQSQWFQLISTNAK